MFDNAGNSAHILVSKAFMPLLKSWSGGEVGKLYGRLKAIEAILTETVEEHLLGDAILNKKISGVKFNEAIVIRCEFLNSQQMFNNFGT